MSCSVGFLQLYSMHGETVLCSSATFLDREELILQFPSMHSCHSFHAWELVSVSFL